MERALMGLSARAVRHHSTVKPKPREMSAWNLAMGEDPRGRFSKGPHKAALTLHTDSGTGDGYGVWLLSGPIVLLSRCCVLDG